MRTIVFENDCQTAAGPVEGGVEYLAPIQAVDKMLQMNARTNDPAPTIKAENVLAQLPAFDGSQKSVLVVVTDTGSLAIPAAQVIHTLSEKGVAIGVYVSPADEWLFVGSKHQMFVGGLMKKVDVLSYDSVAVIRARKRTDNISVAEGLLSAFNMQEAITSDLLRLHIQVEEEDAARAIAAIRRSDRKTVGVAPLAWSAAQEWALSNYQELIGWIVERGFNVPVFVSGARANDIERYLLTIPGINEHAWIVNLSTQASVAKAVQECDALVTSCEYVARMATMLDTNQPGQCGFPIFLSGPTVRSQWEMGIVSGMSIHSKVHCSGCDVSTVCPMGNPSPCMEHILVKHVADAINDSVHQ